MAAEAAAARMFESTSAYPNDCFIEFVTALCNLLGAVDFGLQSQGPMTTATVSSSPRIPSQAHKRQFSVTRFHPSGGPQADDNQFILLRLEAIADINISRLTSYNPSESGWDIICGELQTVLSSVSFDTAIRLNAAKVLNRLILSAFSYVRSQPAETHDDVQMQGLSALRAEIQSLYAGSGQDSRTLPGVDTDIHQLAIETLRSILEQWGDALIAGWEIVFDILLSSFHETDSASSTGTDHDHSTSLEQRQASSTRSAELVRSSFNSLRLICSDFLGALSTSCILMLVDTLYRFCSQHEDFNISLTVS